MTDAARFQPRKRPSQERSRATVDAIVEATVQVLLDKGFDSTTTRTVAERAGVSVGTLYQYFPNREALVAALLGRQLDRMQQVVTEALAQTAGLSLPPRLRAVVGALARIKADNAVLHRMLDTRLADVEGHGAVQALQTQLMDLARALLGEHSAELDVQDFDTACFVFCHALDGVISAAVNDGCARLADEGFLDQLCAMLLRALAHPSATGP